jgi:N-glycosylase/DNA lyase
MIANHLLAQLPQPEETIIYGVKWGRCDELFTPAYWKVQYMMHQTSFAINNYRYGDCLIHEICACLLGGYGIKAEVATSMFTSLKEKQLLNPGTSYELLLINLMSPIKMPKVEIRYRFPYQKAKYLYEFLNRPDITNIPEDDDHELRNWLLSIKGIGLKTASWITRNWLKSDKVAILDIHIYRAGLIAGIFDFDHCIHRDYLCMEKRYLDFCQALDVNAADLDALIWYQLKQANHIAINILKNKMMLWEEETMAE